MTVGKLHSPGKKSVLGFQIGPCKECNHWRCEKMRQTASAFCTYCGQPIGYETGFYQQGETVGHSDCAIEQLAREARPNLEATETMQTYTLSNFTDALRILRNDARERIAKRQLAKLEQIARAGCLVSIHAIQRIPDSDSVFSIDSYVHGEDVRSEAPTLGQAIDNYPLAEYQARGRQR